MKNLAVSSKSIPVILHPLLNIWQSDDNDNQTNHNISLDHRIGDGKIKYTRLQYGLQVINFDILLSQDIEISIDPIAEDSLQFLYCLNGKCSHIFKNPEEVSFIDQFQTVVVRSHKESNSSIIIKKGLHVVFNLICVNVNEYFNEFKTKENHFGKKFQIFLQCISKKPKYIHLGSYNFKIAEQLKLIVNAEYNNEISKLLSLKGRYYLVLAKHIEQFYADIENNSNTSGLLKDELKRISKVSEFIKKHPEIQHSIQTLCAASGLSPAKLQEGFRFMFDRTVSDYVRNIRLEKAEKLIQTTDLTISEIVYSVGLTSRSYFCKIFKKKYRFSPKEYKSKTTNT
ncbi:helix-turn-helix transcriptional regulator [Aquimarina algicola]|uniref:Helix-turn-helix transcriptional regulator n=1 Tax=Aquimarina algicola TaxID=2589995 RepID=A0A504J0W1_9FLAO|nr:AraC family transcriptional regulator [Aquimarina algicola]TPN84457.1 helix-turn-helix transcriptional regulator [Aquimarina algicola]